MLLEAAQQIETFVCRDLNIAAFRVIHQAQTWLEQGFGTTALSRTNDVFCVLQCLHYGQSKDLTEDTEMQGPPGKVATRVLHRDGRAQLRCPCLVRKSLHHKTVLSEDPMRECSPLSEGDHCLLLEGKYGHAPFSLPGIPGTVKSCLHYYAENSVLSQLLALLPPANL